MVAERPLVVPVGSNPTTMFGLDSETRVKRLAGNRGFEVSRQPRPGRASILANLDFAWDPAWLDAIEERPGSVLTLGGQPVLAHVPAGRAADGAAPLSAEALADFESVAAEDAELTYPELRKRERPFVMPLEPATAVTAERAAYDASYKGVTDALTLYLWRRPAFYLTKWAAEAGLTPNLVTAVGAVLCVAAFWLFWIGQYWPGVLAGFAFMVLDTVDGKLARCTGASSKWGNLFDHGIDLVHPPFWWWAWAHGLGAFGTPLEPVYKALLLGAIVGGYIAQRVIEGIFMRRYGMHIHVWRPLDSKFRLVTARRNPNMVILVAALLFGRPDVGFELIAAWTIVSLIFHAVRLSQANGLSAQRRPVVSWLG